jgi:hypothetical protein
LLPEHDQDLFSTGEKKFWKDQKIQGVLKCPESYRNTTRQALAGTETDNNYHLNMAILFKPKFSTPTKPEKQKPVTKGK